MNEEIDKGGTYHYRPKHIVVGFIDENGERVYKLGLGTIDGEVCSRPPREYPYSYSRFCIYKNGFKPTDSCVFSDRLSRKENYDKIFREVLGLGQYYSDKRPEKIEEFLRQLFEQPDIVLTGIEEECNYSDGYPYWLLYFRHEDKADSGVSK